MIEKTIHIAVVSHDRQKRKGTTATYIVPPFAVAADLATHGEAVWDSFKRGREEQAQYYRGLVDSLCHRNDNSGYESLFQTMERKVKEVFPLAPLTKTRQRASSSGFSQMSNFSQVLYHQQEVGNERTEKE